MGKDYKDIGKEKRLTNGQAFGGREECSAMALSTHIHTNTCTYACTCTHTYTHVNTHMHTYTHTGSRDRACTTEKICHIA